MKEEFYFFAEEKGLFFSLWGRAWLWRVQKVWSRESSRRTEEEEEEREISLAGEDQEPDTTPVSGDSDKL